MTPISPDAASGVSAPAMAAAQQLPPALSGELLAPAREAFTSGLNAVGAVLLGGLGLIAVTQLRQVRPASEAEEQSEETESSGGADEHALSRGGAANDAQSHRYSVELYSSPCRRRQRS